VLIWPSRHSLKAVGRRLDKERRGRRMSVRMHMVDCIVGLVGKKSELKIWRSVN